jgi:hypothetical protein
MSYTTRFITHSEHYVNCVAKLRKSKSDWLQEVADVMEVFHDLCEEIARDADHESRIAAANIKIYKMLHADSEAALDAMLEAKTQKQIYEIWHRRNQKLVQDILKNKR